MMKKRDRDDLRFRRTPAHLKAGAPGRTRPPVTVEDTTSLAVVPDGQFADLLTMLDRPSDVPTELRREVARRRWA